MFPILVHNDGKECLLVSIHQLENIERAWGVIINMKDGKFSEVSLKWLIVPLESQIKLRSMSVGEQGEE